MCEVCVNTHFSVNRQQQYDPTRTTTLRNRFSSQMRKRFDRVSTLVVDAVDDKDVFGLKENNIELANQQATPNQFNFPTSERKIQAFMDWIQELIDKEILAVTAIPQIGQSSQRRWTDLYIEDSYKRGVIRARQEMRNAGLDVPPIERTGGVETSMGTPFHLERVGILFTRVFQDLKGITDQMAMQISRVLSQGMIDGDNPRLIARKLRKVITGMGKDLGITDTLGRHIPAKRRAEMLARTEIIRAHHKATIQEYRNWGIEGVHVMAEFRTAGDNRVCSICSGMQGNTYTLDEAENIIPVHPMCRCIVLPYKPSEV